MTKEAIRHDDNKLPWHLFPMNAASEVVKVLQFGAKKYDERNWEKGMAFSRCFNSCIRHLNAWWYREDNDPESGLCHLSHAACNILFLIFYGLRGVGTDDRPNATK